MAECPQSQTAINMDVNAASSDITGTLTWFVCVYPVADLKCGPAGLKEIRKALGEILHVLRKRDKVAEFHIALHQSPLYDMSFGGIRHLRTLEENMTIYAYDFYLELCMNLRNIKEIHIIAGGSGAYLALRVVNFFVIHGDKYRYGAFDHKWANFLASPEMYDGSNNLSKLFGKLILLCPSLPAVCGLAKVSKKLWPPFYAHTQLQQKIGKTILVDVLEQVDRTTYVQKMDVKGPDVETMTWIMLKCGLQEMFSAASPPT